MAEAKKPISTDKAPATVRPQEYDAGTGWDVGQLAPKDAFRALDGDGYSTPVGPVVHEHPGGHARQIVVKGGLITAGVKRELDAAESDEG
ncbi:hypothetical protein [Streptomyces sp. NPDC088726]|uniref:hypothetical protein n=1 Tax=Streptomyces sp. NPDC088726 TaxID=3365874 RepID=UPI0037F20CE3